MELFKIGFLTVTFVDVVDVVLISFLFYQLYNIMKGTIAAQIFIGLLLIIAFSFVAQAINLKAMGWLLRTLTDIWVIAFIVLFQPELRRLLLIVGRNRVVRMFIRIDVGESLEEVVGAAAELSKKRHGMLTVIIRATAVRMFIETGQPIQAIVSKPLLLSIFNPRSPLHDGAIIIKDRVIEAARCTLPLSSITRIGDVSLGMRHRAALGVSEQADVVVVVVSEETGTISIAENGVLTRGLSAQDLRRELRSRLSAEPDRSLKSIWKTIRSNAG
jgi:diadenylate cyclase